MAAASSRRAYAKVGKFELAHVVRRHGLSALAGWLLTMLTVECDWETRRWRGTLFELAQDTGMTRSTVARVVEALQAKELIRVEEPFSRGGYGDISVVAYDELIIPPERTTHRSLDASIGAPAGSASSDAKPQASDSAMRDIGQGTMSDIAQANGKRATCWRCEIPTPATAEDSNGDPVCRNHVDRTENF